MSDNPDPERLRALEARLAKLKGPESERSSGEVGKAFSAGEVGWRMVTELVAGMLIGFGLGYGLDVLFGTLPLFLIIFTLLGFIAGVRTMMRSARDVQAKQISGEAARKDED